MANTGKMKEIEIYSKLINSLKKFTEKISLPGGTNDEVEKSFIAHLLLKQVESAFKDTKKSLGTSAISDIQTIREANIEPMQLNDVKPLLDSITPFEKEPFFREINIAKGQNYFITFDGDTYVVGNIGTSNPNRETVEYDKYEDFVHTIAQTNPKFEDKVLSELLPMIHIEADKYTNITSVKNKNIADTIEQIKGIADKIMKDKVIIELLDSYGYKTINNIFKNLNSLAPTFEDEKINAINDKFEKPYLKQMESGAKSGLDIETIGAITLPVVSEIFSQNFKISNPNKILEEPRTNVFIQYMTKDKEKLMEFFNNLEKNPEMGYNMILKFQENLKSELLGLGLTHPSININTLLDKSKKGFEYSLVNSSDTSLQLAKARTYMDVLELKNGAGNIDLKSKFLDSIVNSSNPQFQLTQAKNYIKSLEEKQPEKTEKKQGFFEFLK